MQDHNLIYILYIYFITIFKKKSNAKIFLPFNPIQKKRETHSAFPFSFGLFMALSFHGAVAAAAAAGVFALLMIFDIGVNLGFLRR